MTVEAVESVDVAGRVSLAERVHQKLLEAIVHGELNAGDALHDHAWAEKLGVSRTPIREAFKHLERHGLLEVEAARYTKLHEFTSRSALVEAGHWALAHAALADVLCGYVDSGLMTRLTQARARHQGMMSPARHATGFTFFEALRDATANFGLRLGASAAAYRFRLAVGSLPDSVLLDVRLHDQVIDSLRRGNAEAFRGAFDRWISGMTARELAR